MPSDSTLLAAVMPPAHIYYPMYISLGFLLAVTLGLAYLYMKNRKVDTAECGPCRMDGRVDELELGKQEMSEKLTRLIEQQVQQCSETASLRRDLSSQTSQIQAEFGRVHERIDKLMTLLLEKLSK